MMLVSVELFSENTSFIAILQETINAVLESSARSGSLFWCFLLIISVIPVINLLALIVWLLVNSWIFIQFVDYPIDARQRPIIETREWLANIERVRVGAGVALCASVPLECCGVSCCDYRRVPVSRVQPFGLTIVTPHQRLPNVEGLCRKLFCKRCNT